MKQAKTTIALSVLAISLLWVGVAQARNAPFHNPPFDFLFGNHIDTHQETRLSVDALGQPQALKGFFYIIFTGETDAATGLPVARHPRGASHNEVCGVDVRCLAGWRLRGWPAEAKFLYHQGVNGNDHPVWLVNHGDIPQPGAPSHFHWITAGEEPAAGTHDPRAGQIPAVCSQNNAAMLEQAGAANATCPGWFLQLRAMRTFVFQHGGEKVTVSPGLDTATHLNLLTNYRALETVIEPTRGGNGGNH